jgi:hypothetical protein
VSKFRQASATVNAAANAVTALLDGGRLQLFDGTQPSSPDLPPSARSLKLVELELARPAFTLADQGTAEAHPIEVARAQRTGTATWFRVVRADGHAAFDGSVGLEGSDADLILANTWIPAGSDVVIEQLVYVQPRSAEERP